MRVALICPAPPGSRLGNRVTALRWAGMLRELGHRAELAQPGELPRCDVLVALHARRSWPSIRRLREEARETPLVVALTGTDLYRDIRTDPDAQEALRLADRLIVLHPGAPRDLPRAVRAKARLVPQSAARVAPLRPRGSAFEVAVVAHLRPEKDPLRAARAAALLPPQSRVRVLHAGRALSPGMEAAARAEARRNPRYLWLGELPPAQARRLIARSRLLAVTSEMEGGANVVSEAVASGTPVLATRIPALQAVLGRDHPGLFRFGDERALARLLRRAELDPAFLEALRECSLRARPALSPAREKRALRELLAELRRR